MEVAGVGEAPPLIIPVDLGGGDWLEPVTGAAGMVVGVGQMVGSLALGHPWGGTNPGVKDKKKRC